VVRRLKGRVRRDGTMFTILIVLVILLSLFVLTIRWAVSLARGDAEGETPSTLVTTRVWAAGTSFLIVLVLIAASVAGLVRSEVSGVERLLTGLNWGPIRVAIAACAAVGVAPLSLALRAVARRHWSTRTRVQTVLYVVALGIALGLLLHLAFAD